MNRGLLKQKPKSKTEAVKEEDFIAITELPEEFLRAEYYQDWKYLEKLRRSWLTQI
jgi:hypothetical protein